MLVRANCFQSTNGRCDTDIQNVFNSVCFKDDLEWDRYEVSYLANKLTTSYHNKEKNPICNLYYKGFDENVLKQLTFDLKNISAVKNIKGMCMIISSDIQAINYLTDYVCILPVNHLEKLDQTIDLYPIKRYTTNKYIYCIPDKYANFILDDKVWEDKKLLNTVCPF
jgi:hypothetical protein